MIIIIELLWFLYFYIVLLQELSCQVCNREDYSDVSKLTVRTICNVQTDGHAENYIKAYCCLTIDNEIHGYYDREKIVVNLGS